VFEQAVCVGPTGSGGKHLFFINVSPRMAMHILNRSECRQYLSRETSVVIDNTNPSDTARRQFLSIAKQFKVTVRCVWINGVDQALAYHLNVVRWRMNPSKRYNIGII